mmetsp:Transcript_84103/g.271843  ORF Transcript_84103/g.271843 Transcript_84103/m.271843 type:complete len:222 (+) Transcript_84103:1967-2632(+)
MRLRVAVIFHSCFDRFMQRHCLPRRTRLQRGTGVVAAHRVAVLEQHLPEIRQVHDVVNVRCGVLPLHQRPPHGFVIESLAHLELLLPTWGIAKRLANHGVQEDDGGADVGAVQGPGQAAAVLPVRIATHRRAGFDGDGGDLSMHSGLELGEQPIEGRPGASHARGLVQAVYDDVVVPLHKVRLPRPRLWFVRELRILSLGVLLEGLFDGVVARLPIGGLGS